MVGSGIMGLSLVWTLLPLAGLVLLVVLLAQLLFPESGSTPPDHGEERALEIAKHRYVRGEISREEFECLKHDLA